MKVTFVRPAMGPGPSGDALEPLAFAVLSGLTPPDVERVLYDERVEAIPFDEPTDLAALTVDTYSALRAYQIAGEYHRRGVPVVLGGFHPTLNPSEALRYARTVVVGDAEAVWPALVEDARAGWLKRLYQGPFAPLADLPVDRAIFDGKPYRPLSLVQFGRGCPHACDFCSIRAFYGGHVRRRPVGDVAAEIASAPTRHVVFTDDNLLSDPAAARELLAALEPLGVRWSCQASLDAADDRELLRRMARAGCTTVTIGFESLSPASLAQMGKGWNRRHRAYEDVVRAYRDQGIMVYGTFVFGYDADTAESFEPALDFALRAKLFLANFNPLTPTPGAPLYERLRREGRLIRDPWWLDPQYRYGQAHFHPRGMTAEELEEGCLRARVAFHRGTSILRRALDPCANFGSLYRAGLYFATNVTSRREIRRKQGMRLAEGAPPEPLWGEEA